MIPHGGIAYENLSAISGKIKTTDLQPGISFSGKVFGADIVSGSLSGRIRNIDLVPNALSSLIETTVIKAFYGATDLPENTAIYINASGFADLALASASGTMPALGITKSSASGAIATVIRKGLKLDVTSAIQNSPFYVSELSAGVVTEIIPATGFRQRLGFAVANFDSAGNPTLAAIIDPDPFYYNLSGVPAGVVIEP